MRVSNVAGPLAAVLLASSSVYAFQVKSSADGQPQQSQPATPPTSAPWSWAFADSNGNIIGSGSRHMWDNSVVTTMTGTLNGLPIKFWPNNSTPWPPHNPSHFTFEISNPGPGFSQQISLDGGINFGFDDVYQFPGGGPTSTGGVTYWGGIFVTTGT